MSTIESKTTFEALVHQAKTFLTSDDVNVLKNSGKEDAVAALHWTLGGKIRNDLGLWTEDAEGKLRAIEEHANQGVLLGFDGDGASSALLGYLWDQLHIPLTT